LHVFVSLFPPFLGKEEIKFACNSFQKNNQSC